MPQKTFRVETVAQALLEVLRERGIEYFLANAGTDFASLVDAFAKLSVEHRLAPRPVVVPHEFAAVSMAHGYYLGAGRPLAVMVHVTVGTANAVGGVINASRAQVPVLFMAGRTPITEEGLRGARDLHIHWAQESFDQAGMLREYLKWDYELRNAVQLEAVVDRALEVMLADPPGPVYLTLPREVLAQELASVTLSVPARREVVSERFPDPVRIEEAARVLAGARCPLILTTAAGRDPRAVAGLVALAEAGGIGVLEVVPTHLSFPHRHSLHLGLLAPHGREPWLDRADAILVVDADVPWFPSIQKPPEGAAVIHLGVDPFFTRYPMRSFPCDVPIAAAPAAALPLLADAVRRHARAGDVAARAAAVKAEHDRRRAAWDAMAVAQGSLKTIGFAWVGKCLESVLDDETVVVNEYPLDQRFTTFDRPGSFFGTGHSGGLGWGLGAAHGLKLARPASTVIATLGDGAYIFGEPIACHFVARAQTLPVLTVIYNNQRWEAVKGAALGLHPDGWAARTGTIPLTELTPSPRFEEIVRAFDGHGERVEDPGEVLPALKRGLASVRDGRQAVLNILCDRAP
jgi:acetolactate synthase-1/2/3 large subunit